MEEDRAIADLGPDVVGDEETVVKAPKRRFIGRKAADAKAAASAGTTGGSIEESGAIQGDYQRYQDLASRKLIQTSCSKKTTGACIEQCSG